MADAIADAASEHLRLDRVPTVFGSAHGETAVMAELLDQMLEQGGSMSPISFASSVHNAASGYLSIATGNRGFTTSIAAGHDTVASCLIEAFGLIYGADGEAGETGVTDCLVVVGDQEEPARLVPEDGQNPLLAAAIHVRRSGTESALASITLPTLPELSTAAPFEPRDNFSDHTCVGALRLIDAIVNRRAGVLRLDGGHGSGWATELRLQEHR